LVQLAWSRSTGATGAFLLDEDQTAISELPKWPLI